MRPSLLLIVLVVFSLHAGAQGYDVSGRQTNNAITTAVPFLLISPDPIGAGMGECGVATSNDVYSLYWNPAKYGATSHLISRDLNSDFRVGVSYSPWLRRLVKDVWIGSVYGSKMLSENSVVSASFRYFSMGTIAFTNLQGNPVGRYNPQDWALDVAWSQRLSENFYGAVAMRYIYSNLTSGMIIAGQETKPGTSVAADLALFYENSIDSKNSTVSFGASISNIGSKISYYKFRDEKEFIPTRLGIGTSLKWNLNSDHSLRLSMDFNKMLVPTPPIYATDAEGNTIMDNNGEPVILKGMSQDVSVLKGMFQSFYDAPDGFREELREVTTGVGLEYTVYKILSARAGYFNEHLTKGNRKYVTLGLGLKYRFLELHVSRLYAKQLNPLHKTWHFSAGFDLAGIYN